MPLLGVYPEKPKNTILKRHMHPSVPSSVISNSQNVEATKYPSTDEYPDKGDVVYTNNALLLFSHQVVMTP